MAMAGSQLHGDGWSQNLEIPPGPRSESGLADELPQFKFPSTSPNRHPRLRSLSLSLLWRRPKAPMFSQSDLRDRQSDVAVEDTPEGRDITYRREHARSHSTSAGPRALFRRASVLIKGMMHRPPLSSIEDAAGYDERLPSTRPSTSHPWNRLRQAASSRHTASLYGISLSQDLLSSDQDAHPASQVPIPAMGGEPPVIPTHTGAAAKASVAMQNELMARQALQYRWLQPSSSDEDGNDRESGIGISAAIALIEPGEAEEENVVPAQDANISRIDFITRLPPELAIQILSHLDATALARVSRVCRGWYDVSSSGHIWRESCLRQTSMAYAASGFVKPGTGLGVPTVTPSCDWRKIYQVKQELRQRWKRGKARPVYLNGHTNSVYCLQFDEFKIVSGSRDRTIRIWDMHTLECRLVIGPPEVVSNPRLLQDADGNASHYAAGSDNGRMASSTPRVLSFDEHHKASILCLQYDDKILVTGSSDASCIVHDVQAGYRPIRRLRHHTSSVLDLTFDEKHIVTCSKDVRICVWDRETGTLVRQLRGHRGPVNAVQIRGNTIVSCSGDFRVKLWNIDTGKNIREFVGHTRGLACSQFSEDGRYVASAGSDKMIRIWDANTGECLRVMRAHNSLVRSLHIDSISGRLVSGGYDSDMKVWDMETGQQLLDFPRWHPSWVFSAKSDYRRIISTGQDTKILIMDFGADVEGIEMLESQPGSGETSPLNEKLFF